MADDDEYGQAVVIDNGSGGCKAGLAGDDAPSAVFLVKKLCVRANLEGLLSE